MEKSEFKAVEWTRNVRAEHAERLRDAAPEDRIAFYREKSRRLAADTEVVTRRLVKANA